MRIPLSQGKFTTVGPRDYTYLMQWKWHYLDGYAVRHNNSHPKRLLIRMHRIILERMGFRNFVKLDHINRNRSDNRRCNLRPATNGQSQCNQNKQKNNTSGYIGVSWHRQTEKWQARVGLNSKSIYLGIFDDSKEAARVYNEAALKYHGEFAVLNEIP